MKVVVYHKIIDKDQFARQVKYLKNNFELIDPNLLEDYFYNSRPLPENALLITFDDGDKSFYSKAFPVLRDENIPAIVFVITSLIGTNKPFWWDEIPYYIGEEMGNDKVWEVKTWPNSKREDYLRSLRLNSSKKNLEYQQLTESQLKEMQKYGITFANHSHTHPMFDNCTIEELELEMEKSGKVLNDAGLNPYYFAYPNGNYSLNSEKVLKKYGIKLAFLFDHKINGPKNNPLRISRLIVNDTTSMWKYKLILTGWHSRILPFTRFAGKITRKFN